MSAATLDARRRSKSGRSNSSTKRKGSLATAPPPVNGVATGPQSAGPKHDLLRKDLTNRVLYGAGLHDNGQLSPEVTAFIGDSVKHMMRTGHTASNDVQRVSQLAKAMFEGERRSRKPPVSPPLPQGKAMPAATGSNAWMSQSAPPVMGSSTGETVSPRGRLEKVTISEPHGAKIAPRPPSQVEEHRPTVAARFNRLNQDKKWAEHVDEEAAKFKVEQQMIADRKKLAQMQQQEVLQSQMEESHKKKVETRLVQQQDMQNYLAAQKAKDEEAKKREIELKATSKQKRREIENLMREKTKEQELLVKQQRDADRMYVNQIIEEEKEKKQLERQKKALGRQELIGFLAGNIENQQMAKRQMDDQRHMDRRDTIARQDRMKEKEEEEKLSLLRKDEKGRRLMERSAKIQADYDEKKKIQDALAAQAAHRALEDAKRKEEQEKHCEAERIRVKEQNKAKATQELENQMLEKKLQKEALQEKDALHRARVEEAIKLGTASDSLIRQKEAERKLIMQRTLESQIKDKNRRERAIGVPHKVGHDY